MLYVVNENSDQYYDIMDILDDIAYLTESEAAPYAESFPIVNYSGNNVIDYNYVYQLQEYYNISLEEAKEAICEENGISYNNLFISIPEYEIISNPNILYNLDENTVITPISPDSLAYQFCESCLQAYEESGDESWLELILDESETSELYKKVQMDPNIPASEKVQILNTFLRQNPDKKAADFEQDRQQRAEEKKKSDAIDKQIKEDPPPWDRKKKKETKTSIFDRGKSMVRHRVKDIGITVGGIGKIIKDGGRHGEGRLSSLATHLSNHKASTAMLAGGAVGGALAVNKLHNVIKEARNRPKSWIGKKIASLRSLYGRYLARARAAQNRGQASIFQNIASKILGIIDRLLYIMQHKAG